MLRFNQEEQAVHYPAERRVLLWLCRRARLCLLLLVFIPVFIAWGQYFIMGLPPVELPQPIVPPGVPAWVRLTHFANLLFMVLLVRSGLSILMDHPRLYWKTHCTPGSQWARLTPLAFPPSPTWTAKDDARYISPWLALPGYRHTVGVARHWHFFVVLLFLANGIVFACLTLTTPHWRRLVPVAPEILSSAWAYFVHYATLHLPPEPNGFYVYNGLQQLSYFVVVFIMAPSSLLTGLAMSPAIDNHFPWYVRLFGNRQAARSLHFLLLLGYLAFVTVHVLMVILTGFLRNMNHIVLGTDAPGQLGLLFGTAGIGAVVAICCFAHWLSWRHPRIVQHVSKWTVGAIMRHGFNPLIPSAEYTDADISPHFWPNGKMPTSEAWRAFAASGFADYKLRVFGLVEHPIELSLEQIKTLERKTQTTLHHCIQGWSGIAKWTGLPMRHLAELVKPLPAARTAVFYSFGEGLFGGQYYETQLMSNLFHPQTILAYEMNGQPLALIYGAPLRLRVENQLGYKMIKWIHSIEFVSDESTVGRGFGGKNEDDEYFDLIPNI